jgi:membrane protein DedA with SNARE-associated domain
VRRPGPALIALLPPALLHLQLAPAILHLPVHHRFHGPPFDYLGLALGAFASWVGLPGPGEPLLLAAAVLAARHKLDLATVLGVAFLAALAGGLAGWAIGLKAGRALATAPGPLHALRMRIVQRGEEIFARRPVLAILMTPAFVAGIHRVPTSIYLLVNLVSAVAWTVVLGVGGYFIGPPVLEALGDLGTGVTIAAALVLVAIVVTEVSRRYRRGYR